MLHFNQLDLLWAHQVLGGRGKTRLALPVNPKAQPTGLKVESFNSPHQTTTENLPKHFCSLLDRSLRYFPSLASALHQLRDRDSNTMSKRKTQWERCKRGTPTEFDCAYCCHLFHTCKMLPPILPWLKHTCTKLCSKRISVHTALTPSTARLRANPSRGFCNIHDKWAWRKALWTFAWAREKGQTPTPPTSQMAKEDSSSGCGFRSSEQLYRLWSLCPDNLAECHTFWCPKHNYRFCT